jgi:dihydrolipoamide dehydrogenase
MANKPQIYDYDLIVIGSGAAGGVGAHTAARQGKRVAVIEADTIGGECPNYGCIPSKALLKAAEVYRSALKAQDFGVRVSALNFSYPKMKDWKDLAIARSGIETGKKAFSTDGINLITGHAHFISPYEITIGKRRFSAKKFLIATGTHPISPPIKGLEEVGYISYKDAINLIKPLKSVFIIGGGPVGCEFTQLFVTFGTKVTIADLAPRLLAKEDDEIGNLVENSFKKLYGVKVLTGTKVVKVEKEHSKKIVHYQKAGKNHTVQVDEIMVASGRAPNVDLGLENAQVKYTSVSGIKINDFMQTSNKHIYSAGDVTDTGVNFTHVATYQSRIAIHNMFSRNNNWTKAQYHAVPRCVFLSPEIASVGMTEEEIQAKGWRYKVGFTPISVVSRSYTSNEDVGFVKIMAYGKGAILGASIVAPRAGEMIHELGLAVQNHLTAEDIAHTIHAFPTWSEAIRIAAAKIS